MTKGTKKSILIIEDDIMLRDILLQKLTGAGFSVTGAIDAEEAFLLLDNHFFDLILLDFLLPGESGQDILVTLKERKDWAKIPVIIASNLDNPEEQKQVMDNGAVEFIIKAEHTPDEIVASIKKTLKIEG
jgi:DNA-binding response OmpR family regulator